MVNTINKESASDQPQHLVYSLREILLNKTRKDVNLVTCGTRGYSYIMDQSIFEIKKVVEIPAMY